MKRARKRLLFATLLYGALWGLTAVRGAVVAKDHVSILYVGSREAPRVEDLADSEQLESFALAPFLVRVEYAFYRDSLPFGGIGAGTALVLWLPLRSFVLRDRASVFS
jgi:hypothetical protein